MKLPEFGFPLPFSSKKIILGKPSQQLFPLKYEFAWKAFRNAQANHWTPEDIPLGTDKVQYNMNLTLEERHMFDMCLAMLTTQDLVVMGNLEEGIEKHLTCPEISLYLARQTDEEAIHTWSYQWIVESLALEPSDIYEKYLFEATLYNKVKYAYSWHERLLDLELGSTASIKELLLALSFWALGMEGGWFFNGFNWIYALRRKGLMQGTSEIFKYIQRDETLHLNFWIDVINTLKEEYPEAWDEELVLSIQNMNQEVLDLEASYANRACNSVLGISPIEYINHFKHFTNVNLSKLDISPMYKEAKPLSWLGEVLDIKQETNFFEGRVREYRKGGLDWDNEEDEWIII